MRNQAGSFGAAIFIDGRKGHFYSLLLRKNIKVCLYLAPLRLVLFTQNLRIAQKMHCDHHRNYLDCGVWSLYEFQKKFDVYKRWNKKYSSWHFFSNAPILLHKLPKSSVFSQVAVLFFILNRDCHLKVSVFELSTIKSMFITT